jgi:hypothetical protein
VARCGECDFDWDLRTDDACAVIGGFGHAYRRALGPFIHDLDGSTLRERPAAGVWSALEYAAHVRDVIAFYADRIERVLSEERPRMSAADFSSMPERCGYLADDPFAVLDAISSSSSAVERCLRDLAPEQWDRVGIGVDGDERTLVVLARRLAHDGHHHLMDLERLADRFLAP